MNSPLRGLANFVRRLLIATRLDSLVGQLAEHVPPRALWARLRPDASLYPRGVIRRAKRDGIRFDLDLSDYMQWTVYYSVEKTSRRRLYALVERGAMVVDVGSNIGEVLLGFARRVGPSGRAIGFEPNPDTLNRCRANLALNRFSNVEVQGVGLGHLEGMLHFGRHCESNSGADRVMRDGEGTIKVPVTTLDRFVAEQGLGRLGLIKIDVEGFELNVLRGSQNSIERFRPRLFVELCDANLREQGSSAGELVRFLEKFNYQVTDALTGVPVGSTDNFANCFMDVIARPT